MNLILDQNLSQKLKGRLGDVFHGLQHVKDVGLQMESDEEIWNFAREKN